MIIIMSQKYSIIYLYTIPKKRYINLTREKGSKINLNYCVNPEEEINAFRFFKIFTYWRANLLL